MTSPHRQLQVAADTICGTLPHLWRPEWEHVTRPDLAGLLADVYEPYGRLADAVTDWWDSPGRDPWDIPAQHPEEISTEAGWDITDSLGYTDPLLPASQCAHWIDRLAERMHWWRLIPDAQAIVHALERGLPPARADLVAILRLVDDGQAAGTIATRETGAGRPPKIGSDSEPIRPATYRELGLSKRQVAEAREVA